MLSKKLKSIILISLTLAIAFIFGGAAWAEELQMPSSIPAILSGTVVDQNESPVSSGSINAFMKGENRGNL
ncbi:MAG: hypothetical protein ACYDEQ_09140, partial [Desulfocucumaceae bacterium]